MTRRVLAIIAAPLLLVAGLGVTALVQAGTTTASSAGGVGASDPADGGAGAGDLADGGAVLAADADAASEQSAADGTGGDPAVGAAGVAELRVRTDVAARQAALTAALQAYAATVPAQFAVAVLDRRTGETYSFNGDLLVRTASVVKVDILAAVLLRAQDEGRGLTTTELNLADVMIRESDNDAASTLWWSIGGSSGLAAAESRLGLTETTPGPGEYWGATTTTVADRLRLLATVLDPAGPLAAYRDYVLGLMATVVDDQDWGVSAAVAGDESVALKNGWVPVDDAWTVNSIGRITGPTTDVTIAVLTRNQDTYTSGVTSVEQIVTTVRTHLAW